MPLIIIGYINFKSTNNALIDEAKVKLALAAAEKSYDLKKIFDDILTVAILL